MYNLCPFYPRVYMYVVCVFLYVYIVDKYTCTIYAGMCPCFLFAKQACSRRPVVSIAVPTKVDGFPEIIRRILDIIALNWMVVIKARLSCWMVVIKIILG